MNDFDKGHIRVLLEWRDAAMRTCPHLGMSGDEMGAYLVLCRKIGKAPHVGGAPRPDLLECAEEAIAAEVHPTLPLHGQQSPMKPDMNEHRATGGLVEHDQMLSEMRGCVWLVVLPIAFIVAATFLSCGGGIALVILACRI